MPEPTWRRLGLVLGWSIRFLPGDADELRELWRAGQGLLAHDAETWGIDLLVVSTRFQSRCLESRQRVLERPVRDGRRAAAVDDPGGVLGLSGQEFLSVGIGDLRVCLHDDSGFGVVDAGFPG